MSAADRALRSPRWQNIRAGDPVATRRHDLLAHGDGILRTDRLLPERQSALERDVAAICDPRTPAQYETGWSVSGRRARTELYADRRDEAEDRVHGGYQ